VRTDRQTHIYADLTLAEAKASYELRCARSQHVSASQIRGRRSAVNSNHNHQQDGDAAQGATVTSLKTSVTVFTLVPTVALPDK